MLPPSSSTKKGEREIGEEREKERNKSSLHSMIEKRREREPEISYRLRQSQLEPRPIHNIHADRTSTPLR